MHGASDANGTAAATRDFPTDIDIDQLINKINR
jgi:hypothetical protein